MAQKSKTNWFQITSFIITILSIVIGGYGLFQKNKELKQLSGLSGRLPGFLKHIAALREEYPERYLGNRERNILFASGARVSPWEDAENSYKVTSGENSFVFTYNKRGFENFIVVN